MSNNSYSPELDEVDVFFSPTMALKRLLGVYEMEGLVTGLKSSVFQAQRESWAAAVFLLGYGQLTKTQYWLRENPKKHLAPDVFAITPRAPGDESGYVSREVMEIEVCEYDEHATADIPGHIKAKLEGKNYHPSTFLLCYVHVLQKARLIDIIEGLKDFKPSVREIWLLFHLNDGPHGNFYIARVYLKDNDLGTTNLQYKGNYLELMKLPQKDMIKTSRGAVKKINFEPLGIGIVPLPRIKKNK